MHRLFAVLILLGGCSHKTPAAPPDMAFVPAFAAHDKVRPGGVKADPSDVILASITAPPSPVGVSVTMPCADQVNTPSCPILNHSCVTATNASFFGDPAVRVHAVVDAAVTSQTWSMCDIPYQQPVQDLAQKIIARLR